MAFQDNPQRGEPWSASLLRSEPCYSRRCLFSQASGIHMAVPSPLTHSANVTVSHLCLGPGWPCVTEGTETHFLHYNRAWHTMAMG